MFYVMDVDKNGMLTYDELRRGTRVNLHIPESTITDSDLRYIFNLIDKDRSGQITFKEYMGYIKHGDEAEHLREEQLKLKRMSDARRQIQIRIAKSGVRNNPDQIRNIFARYDEDYSGNMSSNEF